jgi:hypothetical protein
MSWWDIINMIAIWACAFGAVSCAISVIWLIRFQRRHHEQAMLALRALADTYEQAWTIVGADIEALKERITELETFRQ